MHTLRYIAYGWAGLWLLLMVAACKARKAPLQELPVKTAFYTIEAERDSMKRLTTFRIINVKVVDAQVNYRVDDARAGSRDYLKIEVRSKHAPPLTAYSEHPLFRKFDLYEEGGEIGSKLISLPKGRVTVRLPYYEPYSSIRITETVQFKTQKPISLSYEN